MIWRYIGRSTGGSAAVGDVLFWVSKTGLPVFKTCKNPDDPRYDGIGAMHFYSPDKAVEPLTIHDSLISSHANPRIVPVGPYPCADHGKRPVLDKFTVHARDRPHTQTERLWNGVLCESLLFVTLSRLNGNASASCIATVISLQALYSLMYCFLTLLPLRANAFATLHRCQDSTLSSTRTFSRITSSAYVWFQLRFSPHPWNIGCDRDRASKDESKSTCCLSERVGDAERDEISCLS